MSAVPETLNLSLLARQYVANGWALVPIPTKSKRPTSKGWNRRENCVTTVASCARIRGNVGLAHAFSRTCVLDFDDLEKATKWLAGVGLNFDDLWNHPLAVRISSGRPDRGKLLFKLPDGITVLRTHQLLENGIELRCGSSRGTTAQDVLPPSIHPDTGRPYEWDYTEPLLGDWRNPPVLPADVLAVWLSLSAREESVGSEPGCGDVDAARSVLSKFDPDVPYPDWFEIGAALHHEFDGGVDGLDLWDEWSSDGSKYNGIEDLEKHWVTMDAARDGAKSTLDGLRAKLRARSVSESDFEALVEQAGEKLAAEPESDFEDLGPVAPEADRRKKARPFQFISAEQFMQRPAPTWVIRGVLPKAVLAVLYGASGSGKTFVALDMALAISRGIEWRGLRTAPGNVAYVVAEGAGGFQVRLAAYCRHNDIEPSDLRLNILDGAPNMMDVDQVAVLAAEMKKLGPLSVVFVDTYARVMGNGNENDAKDTNRVVDHCYKLHKETGALVVLVHHTGKDETKGARGNSALRAAADVELAVTRTAKYRAITISKMKDGKDGDDMRFQLNSITIGVDDEGEEITSCVVEHMAAESSDGPDWSEIKGKNERAICDVLSEFADLGSAAMGEDDLISMAAERLDFDPSSGKKDRRKEVIKQALKALVAKNMLINADSSVSFATSNEQKSAD